MYVDASTSIPFPVADWTVVFRKVKADNGE